MDHQVNTNELFNGGLRLKMLIDNLQNHQQLRQMYKKHEINKSSESLQERYSLSSISKTKFGGMILIIQKFNMQE